MVIAFIPLIVIPSLIIPATVHQGIGIWSIIIFVGFFCGIIHNSISCIKRLKEPIEIHIDDEKIEAIFKDGKINSIQWIDIIDIVIKIGSLRKSISILSKENPTIIIYDALKKYDQLVKIIRKCTSYNL